MKMNVNEVFYLLNDELCETLKGEILLGDDLIIWNYDINKDINMIDDDGITEEEVEIFSSEEILQEAHHHDIKLIQEIMILNDVKNKWYFTEPTLNNTTIICDFFLLD